MTVSIQTTNRQRPFREFIPELHSSGQRRLRWGFPCSGVHKSKGLENTNTFLPGGLNKSLWVTGAVITTPTPLIPKATAPV